MEVVVSVDILVVQYIINRGQLSNTVVPNQDVTRRSNKRSIHHVRLWFRWQSKAILLWNFNFIRYLSNTRICYVALTSWTWLHFDICTVWYNLREWRVEKISLWLPKISDIRNPNDKNKLLRMYGMIARKSLTERISFFGYPKLTMHGIAMGYGEQTKAGFSTAQKIYDNKKIVQTPKLHLWWSPRHKWKSLNKHDFQITDCLRKP